MISLSNANVRAHQKQILFWNITSWQLQSSQSYLMRHDQYFVYELMKSRVKLENGNKHILSLSHSVLNTLITPTHNTYTHLHTHTQFKMNASQFITTTFLFLSKILAEQQFRSQARNLLEHLRLLLFSLPDIQELWNKPSQKYKLQRYYNLVYVWRHHF